jgi:hypothetical protein
MIAGGRGHALRIERAFGVKPPAVGQTLAGGSHGLGCLGSMAWRIEKAFGVKRYTLMRMAAAYEIAQTRKREKLTRVGRFCAA